MLIAWTYVLLVSQKAYWLAMTEVICKERKTAILTPSSLACLARTPTVNLTAGCAMMPLLLCSRVPDAPGEGKVVFLHQYA